MAKNTIKLKKYADIVNEFVAAAGITPGHLVELTSAGTVQVMATAGGECAKMFVLEDELQGRDIDTAFIATEPVQVWSCIPGEVVYAKLATAATTVIGTKLTSNGNGEVKAFSNTSNDFLIGIALEAKTGGAHDGRVKMLIS